jgi:hypothetical protein
MKVFSPRGHGYIDYLVVLGFLGGPTVFGLQGPPEVACYVLACVHLLLTIATDAPFGLVRAIAFPLHGILEFFVSIALMAMPWLLGFHADEVARNFYIGSGACVLLAFLITDYRKVRAL